MYMHLIFSLVHTYYSLVHLCIHTGTNSIYFLVLCNGFFLDLRFTVMCVRTNCVCIYMRIYANTRLHIRGRCCKCIFIHEYTHIHTHTHTYTHTHTHTYIHLYTYTLL